MLSRLIAWLRKRYAFTGEHGRDIIEMRHALIIMMLGWACVSLMWTQTDVIADVIPLVGFSGLLVSAWVVMYMVHDVFFLPLDSFEPDM